MLHIHYSKQNYRSEQVMNGEILNLHNTILFYIFPKKKAEYIQVHHIHLNSILKI